MSVNNPPYSCIPPPAPKREDLLVPAPPQKKDKIPYYLEHLSSFEKFINAALEVYLDRTMDPTTNIWFPTCSLET